MTVRIEFLGTPRLYAQTDFIECEASTIAEAIAEVHKQMPEVGQRCLDETMAKAGFLLGLNSRFDKLLPETTLADGDTVQLLSADVGGC